MKQKKLALGILLLFLLNCNKDSINNSVLTSVVSEEGFGEYSKGRIFVGDQAYLDSLDVKEGDVLVLDERDGSNPNMKVYNSAMITDEKDIESIISYLLHYEEIDPSDWNRTFLSMKKEWLWHNISYAIRLRRDLSKDVDLDNADENNFIVDSIKKYILKR
jgi:hypothetical protein